MCRNIRPLNNFDPPASRDEVTAAALQYVRKVSGFQKVVIDILNDLVEQDKIAEFQKRLEPYL